MKYIIVEGNIGAGKTSLVTKLSSDLGAKAILEEFAENTFLPQFYEEPDKYAFPLELSFLAARYKQLSDLFENNSEQILIADYHFVKSLLFASVNLQKTEFSLYESFFNILNELIPKPDLLIMLKKDTGLLLDNIKKRGRSFESNINETYLKDIESVYNKLLDNTYAHQILELDINAMDFVASETDYELIINHVKSKL